MRMQLVALQNQLINIAGECILEKKEEIIGLVAHQHEVEHVDSEGDALRAYHPTYRQHKIYSGKSGLTDFDETGYMHATMNIAISGDEYVIDSPAETDTGELKSEWLKNWQGAPVMDLTTENKALAAEIIKPLFLERAKSLLD